MAKAAYLNRLTNTNVELTGCSTCPPVLTTPPWIEIPSTEVDPTAKTAMTVVFDNVRPLNTPPGTATNPEDTLRITVAGTFMTTSDIQPSTEDPFPLVSHVFTDVYVYDFVLRTWRLVAIGDVCQDMNPNNCPPVAAGYRHFAPIEETDSGRRIDFRRTFDLSVTQPGDKPISWIVGSAGPDLGKVKIKFVTYAGIPFTMQYDLVQAAVIPETAAVLVPSNIPRQWLRPRLDDENMLCITDLDYDNDTDSNDFAIFMTYFDLESPMVDFNGDTIVDVDDMVDYFETWCPPAS